MGCLSFITFGEFISVMITTLRYLELLEFLLNSFSKLLCVFCPSPL